MIMLVSLGKDEVKWVWSKCYRRIIKGYSRPLCRKSIDDFIHVYNQKNHNFNEIDSIKRLCISNHSSSKMLTGICMY